MNKITNTKMIYLLVSFLCIGLLCGCGGQNNSDEPDYADSDFLKAMAKGLEARWDVDDPDTPDKDHYTTLVDSELSGLEQYTSKMFKDTKLQELAIQYINLLKQQKEALDYYDVEPEKYDKLWSEAYDQRSKIITQISQDYELPISSKYDDTLKEMTTNAKGVEEQEALDSEIEKMIETGEFSKKENYGAYECTLVLTNTTGKEFDYFGIEANFLDKDGVIINSTGDGVNNWKPDTKVKFNFYVPEKFKEYEITTDTYTVKD